MKKVLSVLILAGLLTVMTVPLTSLAAQPEPIEGCVIKHQDVADLDYCPGINSTCLFSDTTKNCGVCCTLETIYKITDWIFFAVIALSVIMTLVGGFTILTAGGDTEKVAQGKNYITYAVVGVAVALLAKAVPSIARALIV